MLPAKFAVLIEDSEKLAYLSSCIIPWTNVRRKTYAVPELKPELALVFTVTGGLRPNCVPELLVDDSYISTWAAMCLADDLVNLKSGGKPCSLNHLSITWPGFLQ